MCSRVLPRLIRAAAVPVLLFVAVSVGAVSARAAVYETGGNSQAFLNGSEILSTSAIDSLPQWQRVLALYDQERAVYLECREASFTCPSRAIDLWQRFIASAQNDPMRRKIERVNAWFNELPYKQDNWIYGKSDHWASVDEFLEHSGDCEDFAIVKYLTLRELGVPAEHMWIATAYDVFSGTDHAFLIVEDNGDTLVLDNRKETVKAEDHSRRYRPHYLFNENNVWSYDEPVMAKTARENQNDDVLPGNR